MVEIRRMLLNFEIVLLEKYLTIITSDNTRQHRVRYHQNRERNNEKGPYQQKQDKMTAHGSIQLLPPACSWIMKVQ
jgi:hypothetical protein